MRLMSVALCLVLLLLCSSCSTSIVPITQRVQANSVSTTRLNASYAAAYHQMLASREEIPPIDSVLRVRTVGARLQEALTRYFAEVNKSHFMSNYSWEYNVVVESESNASCGPGGKVIVNTGMLELVGDGDDMLAAVMAHEIAHAIANHTAERMTDKKIQGAMNGFFAGMSSSSSSSSRMKHDANYLFNVMSTYGLMLPHNRFQESEADHIGLIIMAAAGYNPNANVALWKKMNAQSGNKSIAQWASTHPSHDTRIKQLEALVPTVMPIYNKMKYKER